MASNALVDIVEKMKEGSITRGWGAVCAFSRERLNRILQQQWLEKYDGTSYLPVFSGTMDLNDSGTEYGVMTNVMLGKPLLSFEPARLDTSRAKLTLSILGGNFSVYEKSRGLLYEFDISEAHGYTLTVELDLSLVVGVVDRLGRVTLDLSKGTRFSCNLAGPAASQAKIGAYFDARFKALPPERQVYVLGILDLKGHSDLTPTNFIVLTQRAPGAEVTGAKNAADGAVVVMIKLRGSTHGGDIPSPERFPYLIPDDGDYSATMVLAEEYVDQSDDEDKLALIQSLLFPGQKNVFVEHSRHVPKDLVIFGSLDPSRTSLTIEPGVHVMKAGGVPVEYKAYLNGTATNVSWSVRSLNSNTSAGTINPTTGLYQPVSSAELGKDLVRNIITASYVDPQTRLSYEVQALLLVTTQSMAISPAVVSRIEGHQTNTVTFVATALSGATLTWQQPAYGTLSATGNTAIYTPPSADKLLALPEFTVVDTIVVGDDTGESVEATVVLTRAAPTLEIEPNFSSNVGRSATLSLTEKSGAPEQVERTWRVIGDGTVTDDGVYTAPATSRRRYDIVRCEISASGMLVYAGYSIVKLAAHNAELGWSDLSRFDLEPLRSKKLFANGYQQLPLEAIIQTNGARLTFEEEDSLKIYYVDSHQEVSEVKALQEGLEEDDSPVPPPQWAQTRIPNRFKPFPGSAPGSRDAEAPPADRAELPNRVRVFMVSRSAQPDRFYALFLDAEGNPWQSNIDPGHPDGIITLEPEPQPTPDIDNYNLTRKRILGGGGSDPDSDYDFDHFMKTTDYWTLTYRRDGQVGVNFQIATVGEIPGELQSIVQWESPAPNETMFSYTGYGYNDPLVPRDENVMHYDPELVKNLGIPVKTEMEPGNSMAEGVFRVGLFRCEHSDGIRQDQRVKLHPLRFKTLNVRLTDDEGNSHKLAIGFRTSDRNRLYVDHLGE